MIKIQQAPLNRLWAELILEELTRLGISHVCVAPGSRSTPLTLAAKAHEKLTLHRHFDERGLGFYALGLAKSLQTQVAVIVTSGTAVANLLPAVVETGLTKEKLVLLTADRPIELIDCGANQAIQQQGIFSQHVCSALALPSPSLTIPPNWLLSRLDQTIAVQQREGGSVHINCPYPEPLYGGDADFSAYLAGINGWQTSGLPYLNTLYSNTSDLESAVSCSESVDEMSVCEIPVREIKSPTINRKGLIVVGDLPLQAMLAVKQWAQQLGWPVLIDPQSGGTSDWAHYDVWLQNAACREQLAQAEVLIQFGARLVSKRLGQFIAQQDWAAYWLITQQNGQLDPHLLVATQFVMPVQTWLQQLDAGCFSLQLASLQPHLLPFYPLQPQHANVSCHSEGRGYGWADALIRASNKVRQLVVDVTEADLNADSLTECRFAANLGACLTALNTSTSLFLGNSLIVRLVDMFAQLPDVPVFSNRGASGIDGLLATAAGVREGQGQGMLCLLGDTSLLYDLNSLALFSAHGRSSSQVQPSVIVVMNNDGGAIFDLLPVPEQEKEALYRMPHGFSFEHAAAMFGLDYAKPTTLTDAITLIRSGLLPARSLLPTRTLLIEIKTPAGEASTQLKTLFARVKDATLL
ncbi:MAG: 2-succinyl-5-enolpyruvyl-6-hydroxy-3-cyclohexene-1-carboxylate synthase [Moritella sp.]|jgi:2-succinyl-5-enolpyruvyl-6-hydroxy-3-cyclohexene-1-carboxylate synthase